VLVFPWAVLGSVSEPAQAARFLDVSVEREGKPILQGVTEDADILPLKSVTGWRSLTKTHLSPVSGASVQPEPDRPLLAVLRGNIVVKLEWAGRFVRAVEASELKLTRESASSNKWYLDPAWVKANDPPGDLEQEAQAERNHNASMRRLFLISAVYLLATALGYLLAFLSWGPILVRRFLRVGK
jgi:hypothetical protein